MNATGSDFSRQLLESHWAYGRLHMDKLRKLVGLPKGDNPDCVARSEILYHKAPLQATVAKSTHVNRRMFMDLGYIKSATFASNCTLKTTLANPGLTC
jgi:hypothetical protein